jgi:hypothetical protein
MGAAISDHGLGSRGVLVFVAAVLAIACGEGDGGDATGTQTQAVGAAPVNSLPVPQTTNEDSPLFFEVGDGNALTVSDADNSNLSVQVIVTNGTFTLDLTGIAVPAQLTVSGNGTFSVTASGSIAVLNEALEGSRYQPAANYNGAATLQINSSDSNGESDLDILPINVTAFNDPPVNNVPTTVQAATEDVPKSFTLSVTDVDVAGAELEVTLAASNATLITLPATAIPDITFSSGDGLADAAMSFTGTLPEINAALNGLVVTAPLNFIGASTLVITTSPGRRSTTLRSTRSRQPRPRSRRPRSRSRRATVHPTGSR